MRPDQWLGVPRLPGPRVELRPAAYLAGAGLSVLVILAIVRGIPGAPVTAPAPPPVHEATAISSTRFADPDTVAAPAPPQPAATARVALALPEEAEVAHASHGSRGRHGPESAFAGTPADGGEAETRAIDAVAGHADIAAGMRVVGNEAIANGFVPIDSDGSINGGFGQAKAPRKCPLGEVRDERTGTCIPRPTT